MLAVTFAVPLPPAAIESGETLIESDTGFWAFALQSNTNATQRIKMKLKQMFFKTHLDRILKIQNNE